MPHACGVYLFPREALRVARCIVFSFVKITKVTFLDAPTWIDLFRKPRKEPKDDDVKFELQYVMQTGE